MCIIKYGFFERLGVATALGTFEFLLLVCATTFIAAGGNIINDIHDTETDRINKPKKLLVGRHISEKNADYLYIAFTSIGVLMGLILSNMIGHKAIAAVFIIVAALLYGYATTFKNIFLIGNVVIASLVAFTPLLLVLFDIFPTIENNILAPTLKASKTILHVAIFAFGINLIRELIKDIQDTNGDKNAGRNTIPVVLGKKRSTYIAFAITLVLIVASVYYLYTFMFSYKYLMRYFLGAVIGPLLYILVKIFNAEMPQNYKHISIVLKVVMGTGICTLLFLPFL